MNKKIFNFGLPRSGTTSFHNFMLTNGFNSIHTNDGFIDKVYPNDYNNFINDIDLENNIIAKFINNYNVFSDLPWYSIKLRDKIIDKYKNDKNVIFVATIRDKKEWIKSIKKIIPCIKSEAEKNFHDMEYNGILTNNCIDIDEKLDKYYENFYSSIDQYVIKLWLNDTDDIKKNISELINDDKIVNNLYPHMNS
jgi:hypothetical protein